VGYQAGYSNTTGAANCFYGYLAGYSSTGSGNTFVGGGSSGGANPAGYLSTGSDNNFLGSRAGGIMTTGSKNTILGNFNGNQGGLDIRTASNYIVLSDGDGNPLISTNSTRSVALNGAVPQTGTGITFPATQNASSDANTLDDYEEGTFTATLKGGTTDPTTPVTTTGYYTKIGNLINVVIQFSNVTTTGAAGEAYATGLPFTSSASSSEIGSIMCYQFDFNGLTSASCYVGAGTTNLFPYMSGNNSAWNGLRHNAGTGRYLWMSVTYRAA